MRLEARIPHWTWNPASAPRPPRSHAILRRGVRHGFLYRTSAPTAVADPLAAWRESEPLYLPGVLNASRAAHERDIRRTRALFERTRRGTVDFQREMWRRLQGKRKWAAAGAVVDLSDEREIEKVYVDERNGSKELWAKLSWVSRDERDESVRIRFSFGSEVHDDWHQDADRAAAADRLAEALFPECRLITRHTALTGLLRKLLGKAARLSERIVFANAPGGGAVFHHDHETEQRGVLFAQLAGRTLWFALPKRRLATLVAGQARGDLARRMSTAGRALRALDRTGLPPLERLLNSTPRFTKALVDARSAFVLSAGDVMLLPSHGPNDVAWHSVFALGEKPSLGHSYGVF